MSPWSERYVVFDCETTGLDPAKDGILSIGAVPVEDGEIVVGDAFEAVLNDWRLTPAVLVHGITPGEAARGLSEVEAVGAFLDYVGDAVLVGHHVGFDRSIVAHAAERLGRTFANPAIDTMRLALEERGVFGEQGPKGFELDALCALFGVEPHDRHTAPGDAFLTARVFVRLRRLALRAGLEPSEFYEPVV